MKLSQKQLKFLATSNARLNIADGAVRSGKTFIFNIRWLDYIANGPDGVLMMVGKTIRTLENNVLMASPGGLFEMLGEGNYKYNRSNGELYIGNRKILCIGANDEKSEGKIRGLTLAGAICDEITLYPQNFVNQLIARCSVKGAQLFWNCNPDSTNHFIKTDFIDNPKLKGKVKQFHFLMEDNPSLDPQYVADLKLMYSGVWYKRMIQGLWVQAEGLIYDMFGDRNIVTNLPQQFDRYYVSCDYGTQNPCVFLLFGVKDDSHYLIKEYYYDGRNSQRQKTDEEYAIDFEEFVANYKLAGIAVDPSAASFIAALRKRKFVITPAKNSVLDGIRTTATFISLNKFFVHHSCKNTIKEFSAYSWDLKASKNGEDKPIKEYDHCLIGDTIINTPDGDFAIKDLVGKTGDVYCYDENKRQMTISNFFDVRMTQKNVDIFEIQLEDGGTIKLTANHPVLTASGWKRTDELTEEDEILKIIAATPHYVKIKAIKKLGKADVYNMEVAKHHNFSVNGGYIVHNCMDAIRYYCNTFAGKPQIKTFNRSLLAI